MDRQRPAWWKMLRLVSRGVKVSLSRYGWFRQNSHNETTACNLFDHSHVSVGRYTYGPLRVIDGPGPGRLRIGAYCSIAEDVTFVLNGDHPLNSLSTFPFRAFVLGQVGRSETRGDIILGDDVWLGFGAVVLSGVSIGQGAVVAAGAVVARDCPPYSIVAGVPAKVIGYRFSEPIRSRLEHLDIASIDPEFIRERIDELENASIDTVLNLLHAETSCRIPPVNLSSRPSSE